MSDARARAQPRGPLVLDDLVVGSLGDGRSSPDGGRAHRGVAEVEQDAAVAERAGVEAARRVEHDAPARGGAPVPRLRGDAGAPAGPSAAPGAMARATRREEAQGARRASCERFTARGADLTRVVLPARTSMTNCERLPS